MGTPDQGGWLEVRYGEDGNALALTVHAQCSDPSLNSIPLACRSTGHAEAIALSCAWSCASEQHYTYAWDEVNRIAEARRFDRDPGGSWSLAVQQRYLYDSANQRTVKSTTFRDEETVTTRAALYVYPGDFERRGLVVGFGQEGPTYQAISGDAETQYVVGGARIVWRSDRDGLGIDRDQRITIGLTDLIQSTTAVLDLASGELVETGSYYANGARETYRASSHGDRVAAEPMGFTGKEADEEVGLTYFGQRYLVSHLGRWASPDPLQTHAVGGGEAINGYHYVAGNLLQANDPAGLEMLFASGSIALNDYGQMSPGSRTPTDRVGRSDGAAARADRETIVSAMRGGIAAVMDERIARATTDAERATLRAERDIAAGGIGIGVNARGEYRIEFSDDSLAQLDALARDRVGGSLSPEVADLRDVTRDSRRATIGFEAGSDVLGAPRVRGDAMVTTEGVTFPFAHNGPMILLDRDASSDVLAESSVHETNLHVARLWGGRDESHPFVNPYAAFLRRAISGRDPAATGYAGPASSSLPDAFEAGAGLVAEISRSLPAPPAPEAEGAVLGRVIGAGSPGSL